MVIVSFFLTITIDLICIVEISDGRNRLVWTIDHNYNVTTYAYGAEGLIWSLCDGEYMIYHYDYRGSVVAVTDIDGNVTDTIKYDAYGSIAERTGVSKIIFGYNGKYGVLSDSNGLIYMRTRFYNPILKRFMNADIIDGSIADSTTLNVFAYVNGNPISYIDPFGLSAERTDGIMLESIRPGKIDHESYFAQLLANQIVDARYTNLVIKALNNTSNNIVSYYCSHYDNAEDKYLPYQNSIGKLIDCIESGTRFSGFEDEMKIRIEITESFNVTGMNIMGDIAGFVPILGEIYGLVDYMSEENSDFSSLLSVFMTVLTEDDISKLTPYAKELELLGKFSNIAGLVDLSYDILNWDSPENYKQRISIFVQNAQGASYNYDVFVNDDLSFKEYASGFTGTVIKPEDDYVTVIYK